MEYEAALQAISDVVGQDEDILERVVDILYQWFDHYSWVGIYLVQKNELILGPWKGAQATEHTHIPIGKGICGSAAASGTTECIDDVHVDSRYLACFASTRSEIVVPIQKNKKVIGEIDIDSDHPHAFTLEDRLFLEKVADMLKEHIA
jgi:GAF domain-containing protein